MRLCELCGSCVFFYLEFFDYILFLELEGVFFVNNELLEFRKIILRGFMYVYLVFYDCYVVIDIIIFSMVDGYYRV